MNFFGTKGPSAIAEKTVLVIGGGIAGLAAAYSLRKADKDVKIILVDPKEFGEILWAAYRSPFDESIAKGSLIKLAPYCQEYNIDLVPGTVSTLSKNSASCTLNDKSPKTIDFDACIVAVGAGAAWSGLGRGLPDSPELGTIQGRLDALSEEGKKLLSAKSVVVVGGGLIGTEFAGDLADYAKKSGQPTTPTITLIHSGPQLCPVMSEPAAAKVQKFLEDLGVTIILNEKGTHNTDKGVVVLANSKKEIEAEHVVKTIGFSPINSFMEENFSGALDERGWITTDEYLCVAGSDSKVFAFGDCSPTLPDAANVYTRYAAQLADHVVASLSDKKDTMKKVEAPFLVFVNTAGTSKGVAYSNVFWTTYFLPWIKNKTMFFMAPRDSIGLKKEFTVAG